MDAARRKQMRVYVEKAYTTFHGKDPEGQEKLCDQAKAQALPPADFKILSSHEIAAEKEKELAARDPQLAFWLKVKEALTEAGGQTYFDAGMKDALVPPEGAPPLKGKLVRHTPAKNPKELVLALADDTTPEVTIKLDNPMVGAAPEGTVLQFRGVPKLFTREPFMVTFESEKEQVTGWPAPVSKKAPAKKAVKKK